jgi:hypothetical protein
MRNRCVVFLALCFGATLLQAQSSSVSLQTVSNYKQWGWDAIVMQNPFITIATVPAIGGRVMQYDLGFFPSVFVNGTELGKTYTPAQNSPWHNFGGYKTWPAPQSQWNAAGWPPPPTLDFGTYVVLDTVRTNDSAAVEVGSSVENWFSPGIRFIRKASVYSGTSRVKMEETIVNQGAQAATWSMWGVTQSNVNHPGMTDYGNYRVYFPINPNSLYGQSGVRTQGNSRAWKGLAAPGVYGVQFVADNQKLFADPHKGWIAYAVLSDSIVFAKTFDIYEGEQYPDNGSRIAVYVSGSNPSYFEVETTSPSINLAASGGTYTFTVNWWASKVRAPILDVNAVGATASRLSYNLATRILSAVYGVFYEGTVRIAYFDANGQLLSEGPQQGVSPLNEVQLNETTDFPAGAKTVKIQVHDLKGGLIGFLDSADVSQLLTSVEKKTVTFPLAYRLESNYPNPFNPSTVINYQLPVNSFVSLRVYDVLGREIETLVNDRKNAGNHSVTFQGGNLPSGVYFYQLRAGSFAQTKKLLLLK